MFFMYGDFHILFLVLNKKLKRRGKRAWVLLKDARSVG